MTQGSDRVSPRWLDGVEALAREKVPAPVFRYLAEGARDEVTVGEAVAAWSTVRFAPHILRDVSQVETRTTLLGHEYAAPLGIAPMTLQRAADPGGEVAMAAAAAQAGVPVVVSSNAGRTFAEVSATGADWWLQAYVPPVRRDGEAMLDAAVAAGAAAVVLTADTPTLGTRYPGSEGSVWKMAERSWVGANAAVSAEWFSPDDRDKAMDLGPDDIAWLADRTGLPIVVKGVLRPDDAQACLEAGAAAVWVSNHGGRQLDQAVATAHCVRGVRDAVGTGAQVFVDGGVRSGLHVLAALALGADAAFVGRPMFHALAAGGCDGVRRGLGELQSELLESLRLAGCASLPDAPDILAPPRPPGR